MGSYSKKPEMYSEIPDAYWYLLCAIQEAQNDCTITGAWGMDMNHDGAPTGHIYNLPVASPYGVPLKEAKIMRAIGQYLADSGVTVLVGSNSYYTVEKGGEAHELYMQHGLPTIPNVAGIFADGSFGVHVTKEGDVYVAYDGERREGLTILPPSK